MSSLPNPPEWDALLTSAMRNDVDRIRLLVERQGVPASHANGVGQSALHVAALWGNVEAVQALLELGANANVKNRVSAGTPLHMVLQSGKASIQRQEQVVDLLLQYNADPTAMDQFGCLPVDYLLQHQQQLNPEIRNQTQSSIIAKLQPQTPKSMILVEEGSLEELRDELKGMNNMDQKALCGKVFRGKTMLSLALEKLLEEAAAAGKKGTTGTSGTLLLLLQKRLQILSELVSCGARFPEKGQSPAIDLDDPSDPPLFQVLEYLRETYQNNNNHQQQRKRPTPDADADIAAASITSILEETAKLVQSATTTTNNNNKDEEEEEQRARFLHTAARKNHVKLIQYLIVQLQWNVNCVNRQGMTALQFAARSGQVEAVRALLELGADTTHQDKSGQTALDAATTNHKTAVVELLLLLSSSSSHHPASSSKKKNGGGVPSATAMTAGEK